MGHINGTTDRQARRSDASSSDSADPARTTAPGKRSATQDLGAQSSAPVQRKAAGSASRPHAGPGQSSWTSAVFRPDLAADAGQGSVVQAKAADELPPGQASDGTTTATTTAATTPAATTPAAATPAAPAAAAPDKSKAELEALIKDGKHTEAFAYLEKADKATQQPLWTGLGAAQRTSVAGGLGHAQAATDSGKALLRMMGFSAPELEVLTKLFEARFNIKVSESIRSQLGHETGATFDEAGLERCWDVLEDLPPSHVENNAWLAYWTRYAGGGSGSGYYSTWKTDKSGIAGKQGGESAVAYDPAKINDPNKAAQPGDPLYDVTRFNKVVRHEVGHAVDKKLGASDTYCIGNKDGGDWKDYGAPNAALVAEIVTASAGAIDKWADAGEKDKIVQVLLDSMTNGTPDTVNAGIDALGLDATKTAAAKGDKATTTVIESGRNKSPWYTNAALGHDVGGRHYQEAYPGQWVSYDADALARKVSLYQFRAPGEWFAEAYATYYEPDSAGTIGTLLEGRDAATKKWFDDNVHTK